MNFDITLRIASLVAQASIPVAIFFAGRAIAKAQYLKSAQEAWNEYTKLVLSSPENLKVAREYLKPPEFAATSDELMRKAFMAFVLLNSFSAFYIGAEHGLIDKSHMKLVMNNLLKPLLKDQNIYDLTQNRGYHPDFRDYCQELRDES